MGGFKGFAKKYFLAIATLVALAVVVTLWAIDSPAARWVATGYVSVIIFITAVDMVKSVLRGNFGLDILAVVAMVASLLVGEYIAATIIALMLTGGEALEDYAASRAQRELTALVDKAPDTAHRITADGSHADATADALASTADHDLEAAGRGLVDVPVTAVEVGDVLLVRPSEVVPVDAELLDDHASVDEASLTGEPLPLSKTRGEKLMSGSINGHTAIRVRAVATADDSQYQRIVQLVREAEQQQAPTVRVADRFAVPFTIVSLLVAGVAWLLSGDPVRFAEVLVLATPCPLLIGAPVAFMGGMSRASRLGVIVKGGATLETLSRVNSAAFDKTGTVTFGHPSIERILPAEGFEENRLLQVTATAEQFSSHVLAHGIVQEAQERGLEMVEAHDASEIATNGVSAVVDGQDVRVGKKTFIEEIVGEVAQPELQASQTAVYISVSEKLAGIIIMTDEVRKEAAGTIEALRGLGVNNVALLTGDNQATADSVGQHIGITDIAGNLLPEDKVRRITEVKQPTLMVGDGINDAPVLAAAGVGVAMGARGASAASESADAVITREDISLVARAVDVGKWTYQVAVTAILIGIALSLSLMGFAAFGFIPATIGALLQEVVDLACILYALRALGGPDRVSRFLPRRNATNRDRALI
ncbi:heavy metal translocating P-type ATPase [Pseudoglutamicibacter cumminsii]|uniref:heavy metal translocating P-type ATPase n=1 Tax=Pseudoglutamicibacter cumminsii TaxID=156979 RepID=UPI00195C50B3|nr:heavy metal translocating P-type ATPase [Pseudoglutamicibacter cumminsii]MBM7796400.1 heavy metal translocating P-type ATPase [Pseudoglutamicibacter cumminsii]